MRSCCDAAAGCDPEVASDAEAEAFTQAIGRGDDINDVAAWVWRAAFRIAAGMLSARRADWRLADRLRAEPVLEPSVTEFLAMLQGLSAQQRPCIALRYTGGFSAADIAGLLGTSAGTVRVQLHRAHQALRASLQVGEET